MSGPRNLLILLLFIYIGPYGPYNIHIYTHYAYRSSLRSAGRLDHVDHGAYTATVATPKSGAWTCVACRAEQITDALIYCPACYAPRYASWAVAMAEHVTEHLQDGLSTPLEVLTAMSERPCYATVPLTLAFIAQQMRLLTKDTTSLARQIAKARSARTMLEVLEHGDTKDKIAVLRGTQVLGDVVEHKGEVTTRFVVETHEGAPPRQGE